eukprot:Sdes_comp15286_c0_seq1m4135
MYWTAGRGHMEMLQFLLMEMKVKSSVYVMDNAAAHGHLSILVWLHFHGKEKCTSDAIDRAAEGGHIHVVRWLLAHRKEGYTADAVNLAAANGFLDIIKLLFENKFRAVSSFCTEYAIDSASANGHLEIVKWLTQNSTCGCTIGAMNGAAASGHINILDFLFHHGPQGTNCSKQALILATQNGHIDVIDWVFRHKFPSMVKEFGGIQLMLNECLANASSNGRIEIFKWLVSGNRSDISSRDCTCSQDGCIHMPPIPAHMRAIVTTSIIELAVQNGHLQIVEWFRKTYAPGVQDYDLYLEMASKQARRKSRVSSRSSF